MPDDDGGRSNALWRLEQIQDNQRDIKHLLETIIAQNQSLIQRGEERGWKIDAILAEIQRGIREAKEAIEKKTLLTNPDLAKIIGAGIAAASAAALGGNAAFKALLG